MASCNAPPFVATLPWPSADVCVAVRLHACADVQEVVFDHPLTTISQAPHGRMDVEMVTQERRYPTPPQGAHRESKRRRAA